MTNDAIMEQFIACNAAIKAILAVLIGSQIAKPEQISSLLRSQAQRCFDHDLARACALLMGFAAFAEDPMVGGVSYSVDGASLPAASSALLCGPPQFSYVRPSIRWGTP
jgi:hypothetical protein